MHVLSTPSHPPCPKLLKVSRPPPATVKSAPLYPLYSRFAGAEYGGSNLSRSVAVPSAAEDNAAAETSFKRAMSRSGAGQAKYPGLQAFCSGIWDRRRRIPSSLYKDPLAKLFEQFDADQDGSLTAEEITTALNSRGVEISTEDVKEFIRLADKNDNEQIEKAEFAPFVFALANAEMQAGR